jgi:hypothetical protein
MRAIAQTLGRMLDALRATPEYDGTRPQAVALNEETTLDRRQSSVWADGSTNRWTAG